MQTRIAPTPSGYLHLGNAWSFVLTWLLAKSKSASLFLRIDDLDRQRLRLEYLEDVFESLHWLGIRWDKGPKDSQEFLNKYSQVHRVEQYTQHLQKLWGSPYWMYPCSCSRKKIRKHWEDLGVEHQGYPGFCRTEKKYTWESVVNRTDVAWRMYFEQENRGISNNIKPLDFENDIVVQLKGGMPAYHLSSVVDDMYYNNNLIVRGRDLEGSTLAQIQLSKAMYFSDSGDVKGSTHFANSMFVHHSLILENGERKLSKSQGSTSLKSLREKGITTKQVLGAFAKLLGVKEFTGDSLQELLPFFKEELIPKADVAVEDIMKKLN